MIQRCSDCKEKLQGGIADSGSTVYVRVSTSNIEIGKIRLDVYKHETSASKEKSSEPSPVYSTSLATTASDPFEDPMTLNLSQLANRDIPTVAARGLRVSD